MQDRERADKEAYERDQTVLAEQKRRRAVNDVTGTTGSRMRDSTVVYSESVSAKRSEPVKKKEFSQKEKASRDLLKAERLADQSRMKEEHQELKATRAAQAEARLRFLLSQSDIFAHFGAGKDLVGAEEAKAKAAKSSRKGSPRSSSSSGGGSGSSRRDRRSVAPKEGELDADEQAILEEEGEHVKSKLSVVHTQPSIVTGGEMRSYQLQGLQWMVRLQENGISGILADEMGLGKTLQSISVLAFMREVKDVHGPHLVMVPKSTLSNWINEFARWCPCIRVVKFHGSKEERERLVEDVLQPGRRHEERSWDVIITTYEVVNIEKNALVKIAWRYLIIDEAHRLKNEVSMFSKTIRQLNTQQRLLLTGTPLQNNLHELWALLNFLLPDVFSSSEQFDQWFDLDVEDMEAKQRMIGQLHKLLRPFMLRRLKVDVEKSLPPKVETILFIGMTAEQKVLYKQVLLRDMDVINNAQKSKSEGTRTTILNIVMQLRKCCNHPYLFPGVEDRTLDPLAPHLWETCGKMVLLDKLLLRLLAKGNRVLIFSQMTRMLDILEDYVVARNFNYCRIDGNTTYEEREDRIQDYNAPGSDKFIFLLSTRAGGLGINLQTADTVIIYDSDWNPQVDLQAQDRAHRIGQKKQVQVFRLVTEDTVEVKVIERAQQKLKLDAMVVQQGRLQDQEKKLSKDDLLDTLRFGADKIFRSKDSEVTDEDIEQILEQGRKRTEEMAQSLKEADKGDMYDFKLDGSTCQIFEGTDYSAKGLQDKKQPILNPFHIDVGKRERRAVNNYSDAGLIADGDLRDMFITRAPGDPHNPRRPRLPRHLRLPKMDEWMLYRKKRLLDLREMELERWEEMVDEGTILPPGQISKTVVLPPELHTEKLRLIGEGFDNWTKVHFNGFIRASARYGRHAFDRIARETRRPIDECRRYSQRFWDEGLVFFALTDYDRYVKTVEKGERKMEESKRLTTATSKLIARFPNPWDDLTFIHTGNHGRIFNAHEDRYLLCLVNIYGYGAWNKVRNAVRRLECLRFNHFLTGLSVEAIGKRC
jgi:SWI/SNF-related matrix-associated actin-dependent regulator of chromatin subfamily A member 5